MLDRYKSSPILNGKVQTSGIGGIYELEQKLEESSVHDEVGENYQQVESQNKTQNLLIQARKKSIVRTFSF